MKKKLFLLITTALLGGAVFATFGLRTNKVLECATKVAALMDQKKKSTGTYPSPEEIDKLLQGSGVHWGTGSTVAKTCPDCVIDPDGYRILIYDEDGSVVIMNGQALVKLSLD